MSLTQKQKANLQSKRIKKLRYKATGLFLYHPATDSWIPAQCDDEGRLVIDPSDLDERYLRRSGVDAMTGDDLKLTRDLMFQATPWGVHLRNHADTAYRDFTCRFLSLLSGLVSINKNFVINLLQHDNVGATHNVAHTHGNIAAPYLDIPLSGEIIPGQSGVFDVGSTSSFFRNLICNNYVWGKYHHCIPRSGTPASPFEGDKIADTSDNKFKGFIDGAWHDFH